MNCKFVMKSLCVFLGMVLADGAISAQTQAYRQTNLTSNVPGAANNASANLLDPWGIAFLPGEPFFVADHNSGGTTSYDATGAPVNPFRFTLPDPAGTGLDSPTGIVADSNSFFGDPTLIKPFIIVSDEGRIFVWGPNGHGDFPQQATLVFDSTRSGAVYKGGAILNSTLTAPVFAATDFHGGVVDTFLPTFNRVATIGPFLDPNLPAGFAPFGIGVIGSEVFVTYALQDAAKRDPVPGAGNGLVDVFDMDGNFVRRFATAGTLNAPWAVRRASTNFGPLSNDILVGNLGDGTISAFDPATGNFVGQLTDGDGNLLAVPGLHGLAFRGDGFGDANTLYLSVGTNGGDGGLFSTITTGLVSATRMAPSTAQVDSNVMLTTAVAPAPGNSGAPTGTVTFLDADVKLGTAPVANGSASLDVTFHTQGIHNITVFYSGDAVFLASTDHSQLQVAALTTTLSLDAPTNAAPGATILLTATLQSADGVPTGEITFLDGNTTLGTVPLDVNNVAALRVNTLATGTHALTASYPGDDKFAEATSAAIAIDIDNPDFRLAAAPASALVIAGQSTQFTITATPVGGFASNLAFSCSAVTGVTCGFAPANLALANASATTVLTVTTSANVATFGFLPPIVTGSVLILALVLATVLVPRLGVGRHTQRPVLIPLAAFTLLAIAVFASNGCGGSGGAAASNRGTASIIVTAQSGAVTHTTTVNVTVQ